MSRHTDAVPPPVNVVNNNNTVSMIREYKLITPLLGGGAKVKHPDSQTVVRASQIRGMLRFWWRAMRAGVCNGNVAALKEREALIWGGRVSDTMYPAKVMLTVVCDNNQLLTNRVDRDIHVINVPQHIDADIHSINSKLSYALFPIRPPQGQNPDYHIIKNVTFSLDVRFDASVQEEVQAAFWAWEMFGGVGARTRRGLGAVELVSIRQNGEISRPQQRTIQQLRDEIATELGHNSIVRGNWPSGTPSLRGSNRIGIYNNQDSSLIIRSTFVHTSAHEVWNNLLQRFKNFRQARHPRGGNPVGASVWPDANSLRHLHGVPPHTQSPQLGAQGHLPKAQFGLPISYQFSGRNNNTGVPGKFVNTFDPTAKFDVRKYQPGVPQDKIIDRHASPVIFRPCRVADGYVGIVLILGNTRITGNVDVLAQGNPTRHRFGDKHNVPITGNMSIMDSNGNPHGPTNTADVLAGLFNFMN